MKVRIMLLLVAIAVFSYSCAGTRGAPSVAAAVTKDGSVTHQTKVSFETDIQPILKAKCQTCHFPGGRMYDKLPFDRAETIRKLGTKLFTRIRDEQDQKLIKQFLSQS